MGLEEARLRLELSRRTTSWKDLPLESRPEIRHELSQELGISQDKVELVMSTKRTIV